MSTLQTSYLVYIFFISAVNCGQYWQISGDQYDHSVFDANENCQARYGEHSREIRYLASVDPMDEFISLNEWLEVCSNNN